MSKHGDVLRKLAGVLDMCDGAGVSPRDCIRNDESTHKIIDSDYAIGICEGKPVFVGDVLYSKDGGTWHVGIANVDAAIADGSWTKPDPYAEFKAAHKAGKVIQMEAGKWHDLQKPDWSAPPHRYRIKPEPVIDWFITDIYQRSNSDVHAEVKFTWQDDKLVNVEIVKPVAWPSYAQ